MYLRSITLAGFKTFAARTEIQFGEGVTAIVGPNGSGKTNIVDAFRWVLGETQARDLRGSKMQEVIYAGGLRKGAAAAAEVALVIDNAERRLPLDFQEVEIRRRLDRDGDSDYFLNGTKVRRRDVIDLLSATGLAVDGYSIITQPDIEFIISCTPQQRRGLIEEAARIRGIKARRGEATDRLRQLAQNMTRLEDVRAEIEPRLEVVRAQAAAAREAADATRRLEVLRGSIAWEEWRDTRDTYRRAHNAQQALERRVSEAREEAQVAESRFQAGRAELQRAQDRRLQHQRMLGELKLELARSEHALALVTERIRNLGQLADSAAAQDQETRRQLEVAAALREQLAGESAQARAHLDALPEAPPAPDVEALTEARDLRRSAEEKRRAAGQALSRLATIVSRREFLEQAVERLRVQVEAAEAALPQARAQAAQLEAEARETQSAAAELLAVQAELSGLAALETRSGELPKLEDVIKADAGYEAALSAALGPLAEALVAGSQEEAAAISAAAARQVTVLYPRPADPPREGSLYHHVRFGSRYESLARRFLGAVAVDEPAPVSVTRTGEYWHPGLRRAGEDVRARLLVRRRELERRLERLQPVAAGATAAADRSQSARGRLAELEATAGGRRRLEESSAQLAATSSQEQVQAELARQAEARAVAAEAEADRVAERVERAQADLAAHEVEVRRLEGERSRWRDRAADLERQLAAVENDIRRLATAQAARRQRLEEAAQELGAARAEVGPLEAAAASVRDRLESTETDPDVENLASALTRELIGLEEARVDARLKLSTLEGNLNLMAREAELAAARMEQLRETMPEGMAPEEVPGGKAREREMRGLERRLEELGPTNPLAEAEFRELESRYSTLLVQLDDLRAARADLEELIGRLQQQEDTRYDAVFGAVTTHFREAFAELSAGGKATLRNVQDADGVPGLEILVQPPRKRLQTVSLLSSGERALTALALMFALQQVNPSPFVILDEVDAALDDANVERFGTALERLGGERQYLVVTHNHSTMARAGALYGIHLDESGTSHVVSARLADAGHAAPLEPAASAATA